MGENNINIPELERDPHLGETPESIELFHLNGTPEKA